MAILVPIPLLIPFCHLYISTYYLYAFIPLSNKNASTIGTGVKSSVDHVPWMWCTWCRRRCLKVSTAASTQYCMPFGWSRKILHRYCAQWFYERVPRAETRPETRLDGTLLKWIFSSRFLVVDIVSFISIGGWSCSESQQELAARAKQKKKVVSVIGNWEIACCDESWRRRGGWTTRQTRPTNKPSAAALIRVYFWKLIRLLQLVGDAFT